MFWPTGIYQSICLKRKKSKHHNLQHKRHQAWINSLEINGQLTSDPSIQQYVLDFYKDLLGTQGLKFGYLDDTFWDIEDKLTTVERESFDA